MKTRLGFVSNSSSSSFCIYGVYLDDNSKFTEELESKCDKLGLYHHTTDYSVYIGQSLSSIKDDETGKQFKDNVKSKIESLGLPSNELGIMEHAWYDG